MLMLLLIMALIHVITLMSSGPDFFLVSQTVISHSCREAMMGMLGVTCSVMIQAGTVLFDLNLILAQMTQLHNIIMVGGGLYLRWMGYQVLRGTLKKEAVASAEPQVELVHSGRSFMKGLLINLASPEAIIHFGPVFSLFAGGNVGVGVRWGVFLLITVEALAWFIVVANLFALSGMRRGYQWVTKWIDGIAGTLFTGLGIHLIIPH